MITEGDGGLRLVVNQTNTEFTIDRLLPNTMYSMMVCASNAQFWMEQDCTAMFNLTTTHSASIGGTEWLNLPAIDSVTVIAHSVLYAIVGGVCSLVFLLVIGLVVFFVWRRKSDEEKETQGKLSHSFPKQQEIVTCFAVSVNRSRNSARSLSGIAFNQLSNDSADSSTIPPPTSP